MGSISGSINLMAFEKAFTEERKDSNGNSVICAVIPLPHNHLTKTEKGNVFVNLHANEIAPEKRKADRRDTHIVNQDPGKEIRQKLKDAGKYPTTLGNLVDWDQSGPSEQAAATSPAQAGFAAPPNTDNIPF